MPRKPPYVPTPEEEAARAARYAELAERDARWGRPVRQMPQAARQEGVETVSEQPEIEEAVEEMALTQDQGLAPEPEPVVEPTPTTPYEIFLSMLPPETREYLDDAELRRLHDESVHDAAEERRKQLRQQARDRAKETAREAAGLLTPEDVERKQVRERMAKRVRVTPTLPFVSDTGGVAAPSITIDGVAYQHGQPATMPLGRALDVRHILYCLQQNELDFEGKGRLHGLRRQQHEANNMVRIG